MAFIPRLSETSPSDIYISPLYMNNAWNAYGLIGWGMFPPQHYGNCTAYAWARFWEPADPQSFNDRRPTLSMYNANYWFGYTQDGYSRGQVPQLGAVACWEDTTNPDGGHVAIVEQIHVDGSYTISESALDAFIFRTSRIYNNYYYEPRYSFQGFIYNPNVDPTPPPGTIKKWILMSKRRSDDDMGRYRRHTRRL